VRQVMNSGICIRCSCGSIRGHPPAL